MSAGAAVTMLDAALDYAQRGWSVFPLHTISGGRCSCREDGCTSAGKHPRIAGGFTYASTVTLTIKHWWTRWPDGNIGIATGKVSQFFAVDVDPRHGGDVTLADLEREHGRLPDTVESLTGGGGRHIFFRYPGVPVKSGTGVLGPGLDVKGDGGYIVAPDSLHASGRRYCWEAASRPDDVALGDAPAWLLERLTAESNGNGQERRTEGDWLALLQGAPKGQRYDVATRIAGHYLGIGRPVEEVETLLLGFLSQCDPPGDAKEQKKVRRMVRDFAAKDATTSKSHDDPLAPLRALADSPPSAAIEARLREAVKSLGRLDRLRLQTVRQEMIALLTTKKVSGAAGWIDSAFSLMADKGGTGGDQADFLADPEPWADPVEGARLLDTLSGALRRYMVMTKEQADTCALWVVFAHSHDAFHVSPILALQSPVMGCGKSRLQSVLTPMLPRALPVCNLTSATLFRTVEKYTPTLLIDEADTFMHDNEALRGIVNSGWLRSNARTLRLVGDEHDSQTFSTWCPKVIAAIGKLPPTIQDRSIVIELKRKAAGEKVDRFRIREANELNPLCRKAARWAKDNLDAVREATPEVLESLSDRQVDSWTPLLAIADRVGGDWPDRAKTAALMLSGGERDPEADGAGVMLIADCVHVFEGRACDRLSTADLIAELVTLEERPWPEWRKGKPITPRALAKLLKPFGIKPKVLRIGTDTHSGYDLLSFHDAYARYIQGSYPKHCQQVNEIHELDPTFNPQHTPDVKDTKRNLSTEKQTNVKDVKDKNPENEPEDIYDPDFDAREAVAWEAV